MSAWINHTPEDMILLLTRKNEDGSIECLGVRKDKNCAKIYYNIAPEDVKDEEDDDLAAKYWFQLYTKNNPFPFMFTDTIDDAADIIYKKFGYSGCPRENEGFARASIWNLEEETVKDIITKAPWTNAIKIIHADEDVLKIKITKITREMPREMQEFAKWAIENTPDGLVRLDKMAEPVPGMCLRDREGLLDEEKSLVVGSMNLKETTWNDLLSGKTEEICPPIIADNTAIILAVDEPDEYSDMGYEDLANIMWYANLDNYDSVIIRKSTNWKMRNDLVPIWSKPIE